MTDRLKKVRMFIKERGYSHSYLCMEVFDGQISRSYISKLLSGRRDGLTEETFNSLLDRIDFWVDSHLEIEYNLYAVLYRAIDGSETCVKKSVLKQLLRDL